VTVTLPDPEPVHVKDAGMTTTPWRANGPLVGVSCPGKVHEDSNDTEDIRGIIFMYFIGVISEQ
jgi:hypothetical protein